MANRARSMGLFLALLALNVAGEAAEPRPPNILFILADDLGWGELSCYGKTRFRTPNSKCALSRPCSNDVVLKTRRILPLRHPPAIGGRLSHGLPAKPHA